MKAYIINLLQSQKRKKYMENMIKQYNSIEVTFIEANDGRVMTEEEIKTVFDYEKSFKEYGRTLRNGEVGATLSHYKIYKQMIDSNDKYAIVFEDDIEILTDINNSLFSILAPYYDSNIPTVILLSGKYEYYKLQRINQHIIASVFDAWGAYAYIINNKAAKIIADEKPFWLADDWWYLKSKGVKIFGITPHLVDPLPVEIMPSNIQTDKRESNKMIRKNMFFLKAIKNYYRFGMRRIFRLIGFYEPEFQGKI